MHMVMLKQYGRIIGRFVRRMMVVSLHYSRTLDKLLLHYVYLLPYSVRKLNGV